MFKWLPDFHKDLLGTVKMSGQGQPSWLHWWFHSWFTIVQANTNLWAYGVAVLETVIALALIFGFARNYTYIFTIFSVLVIWGIAEGFGGPYSGTSTDIGAAVMYAVVAFGLLVLSQYPSSRLSVEYLLEQRISWWHRVAESGKHNRSQHRRGRFHRTGRSGSARSAERAAGHHALSRPCSGQSNAAPGCESTGRRGLAPSLPPTMMSRSVRGDMSNPPTHPGF